MKQYPISLENVSFSRGGKTILENINLNFASNSLTAIMGPSGCGKTTFLRLVTGQLVPDCGVVNVLGENLQTLNRKKLQNLRRYMGVLFQSGALFTDINVFDNVAFPLREHTTLPESMIHDLVLMKLQAVGLRGAANLMANELSGGMARRVALARAIALEPSLMMYDEPFTGQDPISMGILAKLIRSFNDALELSSIIVSHDIQETFAIADRVILLSKGSILADGTPQQLRESKDLGVIQFLHGDIDGPVPFHYPGNDLAVDFLGVKSC